VTRRQQLQFIQQQMRAEFQDRLTRTVIVGFLICSAAELVLRNWPY
jgi:hypothetical protein